MSEGDLDRGTGAAGEHGISSCSRGPSPPFQSLSTPAVGCDTHP